MNRGRVKIKRKSTADSAIYSNSQKGPRRGRPNRVATKNSGVSSKAKISRVKMKTGGNFQIIENVKGLRSDPRRGRVSNRLRMDQEQQESRRIPGNTKVRDNTDQPKLFTKDFDARRRIEAKRRNGKNGAVNKVKKSSEVALQKARQQEKSVILSKSRGFSMVGNQMKIVSKVEAEKKREATFTGTSLRVTTLQTEPERMKHRETSTSGSSFIIRTENKRDDTIETEEASAYSLFEARRKAQQQEAAKTQVRQKSPKLASLNPISRPKRPPPVYEYEDTTSHGHSSKLLVSNLHPNVSQDDIYELFSAVAPIKSGRITRQGVAEVLYHSHQDAVNAYKKYHSRNLDGQPMICKLAATEQAMYAPPSARQSRREAGTSSNPVVFTVKI